VPNYVKKVIFPLEILPVAALGAALFHALVSLSILLCANLLINGVLQATVLLLPLVLLPLLMFALGLGWLLASLGVFVRDISYTIGLVVQALFFLTPIFYPLASVPPAFRFVLGLWSKTAAGCCCGASCPTGARCLAGRWRLPS
jgi:lipopolysaccharide transport system permease protein